MPCKLRIRISCQWDGEIIVCEHSNRSAFCDRAGKCLRVSKFYVNLANLGLSFEKPGLD